MERKRGSTAHSMESEKRTRQSKTPESLPQDLPLTRSRLRPASKPIYQELDDSEESSDGTGFNQEDVSHLSESSSQDEDDYKVEAILDMKEKQADPGLSHKIHKEFFIKWMGRSHIHNTWITEEKLANIASAKLKNFLKKRSSDIEDHDDVLVNGVHPDWTEVDRIIAYRKEDDCDEFLVKWKSLTYDRCTWEKQSDIEQFSREIELYWNREKEFEEINSKRRSTGKLHSSRSPKYTFSKYETQPPFITAGELYQYQMEGLNWLRFSHHEGKNVILADEMGLGKTIQTVTYIQSMITEGLSYGPFMVIAPLSTIPNWERELFTWCPKLNVVIMLGPAEARNIIVEYEMFTLREGKRRSAGNQTFSRPNARYYTPKFHVLLASYESVMQEETLLRGIAWETMIIDEAHRLKNVQSKLFQTVLPFKSHNRILLTGTPLQNNLAELFNLLSFLHPDEFGSSEDFVSRFSSLNESETISELHRILAPHLLRRVKKDVMSGIPPKAELIVPIEMSPTQKILYKACYTRNYTLLKSGGAILNMNNLLMDLRKICNHPFLISSNIDENSPSYREELVNQSAKLVFLDQILPKLQERGHRVLIFSQMTSMLDVVQEYMSIRSYESLRLDGNIRGSERQTLIDRFNAKGSKIFCFLISTKAGGLGINLATADTVIILDPDWNPHNDLQALARAHRIGQKKSVLIYRLVTRSSVEERIVQKAKEKLLLEHIVVRKSDASGKAGLKQEEIEEILKFGAAALFSDEDAGDGNLPGSQPTPVSLMDDATLEKLLDRSQATNDEQVDQVDNHYLQSFKVPSFLSRNQDTAKEAEVKAKARDSHMKRDFWEQLLGSHISVDAPLDAIQYGIDESLGKGKRQRRLVNYFGTATGRNADTQQSSESSSDDDEEALPEADSSSSEAASLDIIEDEVAVESKKKKQADAKISKPKEPQSVNQHELSAAKKFGKKQRLGTNTEENEPQDAVAALTQKYIDYQEVFCVDGEWITFGLSKLERSVFQTSILIYGRMDDFLKVYTVMIKRFHFMNHKNLRRYTDLFLMHLAEPETSSSTFQDGLPKEGFDRRRILARLAMLDLIEKKVKESERLGQFNIVDQDRSRICHYWQTCQHWTKIYDYYLLAGVVRFGYGRWSVILKETGPKFMEVAVLEASKIVAETLGVALTASKVYEYVQERMMLVELALYFEWERSEFKPQPSIYQFSQAWSQPHVPSNTPVPSTRPNPELSFIPSSMRSSTEIYRPV